jgi:hypothetical protein
MFAAIGKAWNQRLSEQSLVRQPSADWFDILFDASSLLTEGSQ